MAAMDASAAIAHMDSVSIPLLVRLCTELKNSEELSAQWHRWGAGIERLLDYAVENYGDELFIRMMVKFKERFGTLPLVPLRHTKRMVDRGVVITKVYKIFRKRAQLGPSA